MKGSGPSWSVFTVCPGRAAILAAVRVRRLGQRVRFAQARGVVAPWLRSALPKEFESVRPRGKGQEAGLPLRLGAPREAAARHRARDDRYRRSVPPGGRRRKIVRHGILPSHPRGNLPHSRSPSMNLPALPPPCGPVVPPPHSSSLGLCGTSRRARPRGSPPGDSRAACCTPLLGLDHLVAMVAVGLWGAFLGRPAIWLLPVVFPFHVMAFGGALGIVGVPLPAVELGIAASGVALGSRRRVRLARNRWCSPRSLVGAFALFHGHAHGTELPASANPFALRRRFRAVDRRAAPGGGGHR